MSETAPEAPAGGGGGGGGGGAGGFFKRKLGPFPMWAWLAIGATVILGYVVIKSRQSSAATGAGTPASSVADTSTPAADVPQFVNQTYTTVTPPTAAPATPPPATTPPPVTTSPGGPVAPARPTQITASGADTGDINQIAKKYGLTEQQLIAANPGLRKDKVKSPAGKTIPLIGSGAPVPKGTVIKIPAA